MLAANEARRKMLVATLVIVNSARTWPGISSAMVKAGLMECGIIDADGYQAALSNLVSESKVVVDGGLLFAGAKVSGQTA